MSRLRMKSHPAMYPLRRSIAMTTIVVESVSSLYFFAPFSFGSQGQEAFWSSTLTSETKFLVLANIAGEEVVRKKHGRRESNPQPAVLETAALPVELLP